MKEIKTKKGYIILVDDCDYERVDKLNWYPLYTKMGNLSSVHNKGLGIGRFILNPPKHLQVDHINRNPLDNRRNNLRLCTQQQNAYNRSKHKDNTSGYKAIYRDKGRPEFRCDFRLNGKVIARKNSKDINVLRKFYNDLAKEHYGEFASFI